MAFKEDPRYMHILGRHFVALTCRAKSPDATDKGRYFYASGFILSIHGIWFLLTAGHIFDDIETLKERGWQFTNWELDDTFALAEKRKNFVDGPGAPETVQFGFDNAFKRAFFNEEDGTDYGFIHVEPFYEAQLRANSVRPFEEEHWTIDKNRRADKVELLGVPSDQVTELNPFGLIQKSLVALSVVQVDEDFNANPKYSNMLHAKVPDIRNSGLENFESIKGMSGGPIIGFWSEADGSETYRILAIQSRWNRPTNTIIGYPVNGVALDLKGFVESVCKKWLQQKNDDVETVEQKGK